MQFVINPFTGEFDAVGASGGGVVVETLTGNSGGAVSPSLNNINVVGDTTTVNVVGNPGTNTLTISAISTPTTFTAYTNVDHAHSPYTVLTTDQYISVDCSGGTVTLKFPNVPTAKQWWVVKDRTGNASTNNISITTPGGIVTIDGQTTYIITSNYGAINILANATPTYEVW